MKLSTWARQAGVGPRTVCRWCHPRVVPVSARQPCAGTVVVAPPSPLAGEVAACARVSSADQRADVARRVAGVVAHATAVGLAPWRVVAEVGSALNDGRSKLGRLLAVPAVATVVGVHRDRLARLAVEDVEASWAAQGRRSVVLDDGEVGDDLVCDVVEVLTSVCARLCGLGSARRRAQRAVEAAGEAAA